MVGPCDADTHMYTVLPWWLQAGKVARVVHHRIAIMGAGFGGLGMAIRLKREGVEDFVVLEREAEVGGTWWANTYPGCQCDVPSHLYSFSFAPNPNWSRTYPEQPELRAYLNECVDRFGVREHIRCNCEVLQATWEERHMRWRFDTTQGELTAEVAVSATGGLSEPSIPDIPGLAEFSGVTFHTARWNHAHDLRGRRVAIVGTGASGVQVAPQIQPLVERLTIFQRTPPWVVPHRDRPISAIERQVYRRFPVTQRLPRAGAYWMREVLAPAFVSNPRLLQKIEQAASAHLDSQVSDPALRAQLTPSYTIGCKRLLPSDRWYPTLAQTNVELVGAGVREVRSDGVLAEDGSFHPLDTIVLATGFHVIDNKSGERIRGVGGRTLAEVLGASPQAYLGTAVAGFPNLFFLAGLNTALGHNSVLFMIEANIHYAMAALRAMHARGVARVEVRREVQEAYNVVLQERLVRSVWNTGGCSSWFLDANGHNSAAWPYYTWRFWLRTRRFKPADYHLRAATVSAAAPGSVQSPALA
jgi:cation diffusion facilitator CzcD-associated flavoprotein CzcO